MNYGIKISQEGIDLATGNTNGTEDDKQKEIAHITKHASFAISKWSRYTDREVPCCFCECRSTPS